MHHAGEAEVLTSEREDDTRSAFAETPALATQDSGTAGQQAAQDAWSALPLSDRLAVLKRARIRLATQTDLLTAAIPAELARNAADTIAAEIMPLLAACRFLERDASAVLRPRRLGSSGRPGWLRGLTSTTERVPLGTILVIGPANYPLFLPGVQVLQALASGNAVIWKPGRGGRQVALVVAEALSSAGLPADLLVVTTEDTAAAESAIDHGVDKIFLTGSGATGRAVLHRAATQLTPVVAELSGVDALIMLPGADLRAVADAVTFSLRLNGSATCMATRRLLLVDTAPEDREKLFAMLRQKLADLPAVSLSPSTRALLRPLITAACASGARILTGSWTDDGESISSTVLINATPMMQLTQTDIFAPVVSIIEVQGESGVLAAQRACPFALTAAIFGKPSAAQRLALKLKVGVVLVNDVIVATADPRLPFGGRGKSGFGSTRGAEGLLEMTTPRVIATQSGNNRDRYEPTGALHGALFTGLAALLYAGSWKDRFRGLVATSAAGRALSQSRRQIKQSNRRLAHIEQGQMQQLSKSQGAD